MKKIVIDLHEIISDKIYDYLSPKIRDEISRLEKMICDEVDIAAQKASDLINFEIKQIQEKKQK
jgi:hypothetical protein